MTCDQLSFFVFFLRWHGLFFISLTLLFLSAVRVGDCGNSPRAAATVTKGHRHSHCRQRHPRVYGTCALVARKRVPLWRLPLRLTTRQGGHRSGFRVAMSDISDTATPVSRFCANLEREREKPTTSHLCFRLGNRPENNPACCTRGATSLQICGVFLANFIAVSRHLVGTCRHTHLFSLSLGTHRRGSADEANVTNRMSNSPSCQRFVSGNRPFAGVDVNLQVTCR